MQHSGSCEANGSPKCYSILDIAVYYRNCRPSNITTFSVLGLFYRLLYGGLTRGKFRKTFKITHYGQSSRLAETLDYNVISGGASYRQGRA